MRRNSTKLSELLRTNAQYNSVKLPTAIRSLSSLLKRHSVQGVLVMLQVMLCYGTQEVSERILCERVNE
jgi:hypothetical protein